MEIKKMSRSKLIIASLVLLTFLLSACCNCGSNNENIVKGVITMVGHDQFSRLAVKLENNKAYLLDCSKEIEDELMKNQGNSYAIQFSSIKLEDGVPVLKVEKIAKINPSTKD